MRASSPASPRPYTTSAAAYRLSLRDTKATSLGLRWEVMVRQGRDRTVLVVQTTRRGDIVDVQQLGGGVVDLADVDDDLRDLIAEVLAYRRIVAQELRRVAGRWSS